MARPIGSGRSQIRVSGPHGEVIITLNADSILAAARDAFTEANQFLQTAAVGEATRSKWDWPVGQSPRDVVAPPPFGGALRSSITAAPEPGGTDPAWLHTVGVSYAAPVLLGYRIKTRSGIRTMPARNIYLVPVTKRLQGVFTGAYARRLRAMPGSA